jgi:hypothetical protein
MGEQQLGHIAAELYALPFDEFVAARTAAAKNAAVGPGRALATAVRALPKPSIAAWAVNILAAHRPDTVRQLSELGQSMRRAQTALDAGTLRSLAQERRQLLTSVMETARAVAEQQGRRLSAAVAAEVEQTLRAATVDERAAAAVRSGQLLRVLSADGVDLVDLHDAVAVPSVLAVPGTPTPPAPQAPPVPPQPVPLAEKEGRPETEGRTRTDQPRLKAVGDQRPAPTPSAVERATARLAEAEQATRSAAEEAAKRVKELEEAAEAVAELGDESRRLRERLKTVDEELDQARKSRDVAAARMQLAARAAEKGRRAEVLARERVLRLRNTPD